MFDSRLFSTCSSRPGQVCYKGRLQKKIYDKLGLLAEAWGGRGQVGAGGPNLLSVLLFIGVILSRGLET